MLVNLKLFGEGTGSAAGSSTGTGVGSSGAAVQTGETEGSSSTAENTGVEPSIDKEKAFEDLIAGEYKEQFGKRTQSIIDKRFKETKNLEAQVNEYQPLSTMLKEKYGVNDVASVIKAVEDDSNMWQDAADEAGMTVEQYKKVQKLQRENEALRKAEQQREQKKFVEQKLNQWNTEAEQLKAKIPSFDLGKESQNPEFVSLLKAGVPVEHAYQVIHMEEITKGIALGTAEQTRKATTDDIRARGMRPAENGTQSSSPSTFSTDVHKLTKAQRAEYIARAARGEKITFKS